MKREAGGLFLLFLLALIFWMPLLAAGQAPFLRDLSTEIIPKRGFWAASQGLVLWDRFSFIGMAYAANPQSEAFYPFNIWFLVLRPERALVFYIVFHHALFLLTLYPALLALGFSKEASLVAAIGFGFGGYLISLTVLIVLLSAIAWFPLLIIVLKRAVERGWFKWGLLLGLVMAIQILAGEVEIAGMSWLLALLAVAFSPKEKAWARVLPRMAAAFALGLGSAVVLSLPQIAATCQMIPLSNRAAGVSLSDALIWSLKPSSLKSFLIPSYIIPVSASRLRLHWGIGFFSGFSYLFSYYMGISLLSVAVFAFARRKKFQVWFWLGLGLFGVLLAMGESVPIYSFLHRRLPWFQLFRIPEKFLFFPDFSVMMLAGFGLETLMARGFFRPRLAALLFLCAAVIALLLAIYPLRPEELGNRDAQVYQYLIFRSVLRTSSIFLFLLGLVFLTRGPGKSMVPIFIGLLIYADLFLAHHRLNPGVNLDFFRPNRLVAALQNKTRNSITPPRILTLLPDVQELMMQKTMDPIRFYRGVEDTLEPFWAMYFGFNDLRAVASFYPSDFKKWRELRAKDGPLWGKMVFARTGIEYLYLKDWGFQEISGKFERAIIFYHGNAVPDQDQAAMIWSDPNFCARRTVLLEADDRAIEPGQGLEMSEPAKIIRYENEKVEIEAVAKKASWLLLLDSYYPGWRALVDGKPVKIYRADGFFRALPIPAGKHLVTFDYHPAAFYRSVKISAAGFLVWLALLMISGKGKGAWKDKTRRR